MWEYNTLIENTATEVTIYTYPSDIASEKINKKILIE
tara:strand:- start:259 stop:369 length:111 start_codon:yes stop_codon:yes gene_type:complete